MKIICIGDQHIAGRHLQISIDALRNTVNYCLQSDVDLIVLMGDILDRHDDVKLSLLKIAIDFIKILSTHPKAKVVVLIGNHDRVNNKDTFSDIHPFMGIERSNNLFIINKPLQMNNMLFVPYVPVNKFYSSLQAMNINPDKFDLVFAHQEFKDAIDYFGKATEEWNGNLLISGHIHEYGYKKSNLLYTGSLYQISYGEDEKKGILHGEFIDGKFNHVQIPMTQMMKNIHRINTSDIKLVTNSDTYVVEGSAEEVMMLKRKMKHMKNVKFIIKPEHKHLTTKRFDDMFIESLTEKNLLDLARSIFV